jgi:hypothetical protein
VTQPDQLADVPTAIRTYFPDPPEPITLAAEWVPATGWRDIPADRTAPTIANVHAARRAGAVLIGVRCGGREVDMNIDRELLAHELPPGAFPTGDRPTVDPYLDDEPEVDDTCRCGHPDCGAC